MDGVEKQEIVDEEHLKLLTVGFIVAGAFSMLVAMLPLSYGFMGAMFAVMPPIVPRTGTGAPLPEIDMHGIGIVIALFGAIFAAGIAVVAALQIWAGVSVRRRKHHVLCIVAAALSCLFVPIGTVVGVCGLLVLARPSVARRFRQDPRGAVLPAGSDAAG